MCGRDFCKIVVMVGTRPRDFSFIMAYTLVSFFNGKRLPALQ